MWTNNNIGIFCKLFDDVVVVVAALVYNMLIKIAHQESCEADSKENRINTLSKLTSVK